MSECQPKYIANMQTMHRFVIDAITIIIMNGMASQFVTLAEGERTKLHQWSDRSLRIEVSVTLVEERVDPILMTCAESYTLMM